MLFSLSPQGGAQPWNGWLKAVGCSGEAPDWASRSTSSPGTTSLCLTHWETRDIHCLLQAHGEPNPFQCQWLWRPDDRSQPSLITTSMKNVTNKAYPACHRHLQVLKQSREKNRRDLHRLWLGRGTHFHHLVCDLKEERKSQYNFRKQSPPTPISFVVYKEAMGVIPETPVPTPPAMPGRALAQQGPPGHRGAT